MSRRSTLQRHRHTLTEIREIMGSMKTLAFIETRKLSRFLTAQREVVAAMERVGTDFLTFHPYPDPSLAGALPVQLLIGSERGFCGEFNQVLLRHLQLGAQAESPREPAWVVVGGRLRSRVEPNPRVAAYIDGANVAEEVERVLREIVDTLTALQSARGPLALAVFYRGGDSDEVLADPLLPPFQNDGQNDGRSPQGFSHPPLLQLEPEALLSELADHYLFARLHQVLYDSLLAENRVRLQHLEGAVSHLDDKRAELLRQSNVLRQEEIIEEIEVIMLSAPTTEPALDQRPSGAAEITRSESTRGSE